MKRYPLIQYPFNVTADEVFKYLNLIRENDGFVPDVPKKIKNFLVPTFAEVEVSPYTGLIIQWKLNGNGKAELRRIYGNRQRQSVARYQNSRYTGYQNGPVVSLTIEVLDALKAILMTGEPQTDKMIILARIQLGGWAQFKDGAWTLTHSGKYQANNHIHKSECAQFSGKVR